MMVSVQLLPEFWRPIYIPKIWSTVWVSQAGVPLKKKRRSSTYQRSPPPPGLLTRTPPTLPGSYQLLILGPPSSWCWMCSFSLWTFINLVENFLPQLSLQVMFCSVVKNAALCFCLSCCMLGPMFHSNMIEHDQTPTELNWTCLFWTFESVKPEPETLPPVPRSSGSALSKFQKRKNWFWSG